MREKNPMAYLGPVVALGAVWGLSEAALGMGLRACAASLSGALMTGAALFFIAAGWRLSRRIGSVLLMVAIAAFFKMFDALLLGLPLRHGAIGNPIFALFMEGAAFVLFALLLRRAFSGRIWGQAIHGGLAALLAANLFPLVRFATGVPACTFAATGYPLSLYYIHVAVLVSLVTVPLGFLAGAKIESMLERPVKSPRLAGLRPFLSPAALALCLALMALLRLT